MFQVQWPIYNPFHTIVFTPLPVRTACESRVLGFGTCANSTSLLLLVLFRLLHCVAGVLLFASLALPSTSLLSWSVLRSERQERMGAVFWIDRAQWSCEWAAWPYRYENQWSMFESICNSSSGSCVLHVVWWFRRGFGEFGELKFVPICCAEKRKWWWQGCGVSALGGFQEVYVLG